MNQALLNHWRIQGGGANGAFAPSKGFQRGAMPPPQRPCPEIFLNCLCLFSAFLGHSLNKILVANGSFFEINVTFGQKFRLGRANFTKISPAARYFKGKYCTLLQLPHATHIFIHMRNILNTFSMKPGQQPIHGLNQAVSEKILPPPMPPLWIRQ